MKEGTEKSGKSQPLSENLKKLVSPHHEEGTKKSGSEKSLPYFN
jgi:hypothetical protein